MLSDGDGARTTLYCATSDDVADQTGRSYDACKERRPSKAAQDEALARELWDRSAAPSRRPRARWPRRPGASAAGA
jgi:retinol dehydrogenase-12